MYSIARNRLYEDCRKHRTIIVEKLYGQVVVEKNVIKHKHVGRCISGFIDVDGKGVLPIFENTTRLN